MIYYTIFVRNSNKNTEDVSIAVVPWFQLIWWCICATLGLCVIGVSIELILLILRILYRFGFRFIVAAGNTAAVTTAATKGFDSNSYTKATLDNNRPIPWSYAKHKSVHPVKLAVKRFVVLIVSIVHKTAPKAQYKKSDLRRINAKHNKCNAEQPVQDVKSVVPTMRAVDVTPSPYQQKKCTYRGSVYWQNMEGYSVNVNPK